MPAHYAPSVDFIPVHPTDSNQEIQQWALKTLEKIYKPHYEYRRAGVILSGLVPAEKLTKRMFDDEHSSGSIS